MDINLKVKPNLQMETFYLFIIIVSVQTGIGVLGVPRLIFEQARQDAWISIIIAFVYVVVVLSIMLIILKQYNNADIFGIQVDIFGKWIGKILGTIYIFYFSTALFSMLITYIEIVRIYVFPNISGFVMGLILLFLIVYSVHGGIRVIVGVCFIFFILSHWVLVLLIKPVSMMHFDHFLPVFQASPTELLAGAQTITYTFIGFEMLFLVYPFIQNKKKVKKPIIFAAGWTAFLTLVLTVISIGFYSQEMLLRREWAVLTLFKLQRFAFVERFDYIVVAEWMMAIIPNLILLMWGITFGMKRLYKVPQKFTLYIAAIIFLIGCSFITEHFQIQKVINFVADVGFWLVYVYPFILLPIVLFKKRWRKRKGVASNEPT